MLTDQELRTLTIKLLNAPTARDKQRRIGPSTLSNGCDKCLAESFLGNSPTSPIAEKCWMGKTWGTAQHLALQAAIDGSTDFTNHVGDALVAARNALQTLLGLDPDAIAERYIEQIAFIPGYGWIGGTIDLDLVDKVVDWKSSTRQKICLLIDYMQTVRGLEPIYGRKHKEVKLSEREYASEMLKMAFKVDGYFGQANLYVHGHGVAKQASLVFLARNGNGYFDNPAQARYEDPTAVHDVYVLTFDYDQAYTEALIARGAAIWAHLQAGGKTADMASHAQCFICATATPAGRDVDVEVSLAAA